MTEHTVFAGSQTKDLLQYLNAFFDRPSIRKGAKILIAFVDRTTVVRQTRKTMPAEFQVGV
jgi:hypothetical protein